MAKRRGKKVGEYSRPDVFGKTKKKMKKRGAKKTGAAMTPAEREYLRENVINRSPAIKTLDELYEDNEV